MKILLTSSGFIDSSLEDVFLEMTDNRTDLKVATIPTAGDPIEWVPLKEGDDSYDNFVPKLVGENKIKILEFLRENEKIRNNDVEKLLGVSDATATRYLNELEKEQKIREIGTVGQVVYCRLM